MANVIQGTYTIRQVLNFTRQYVPNRFSYRSRDVIKRITVQRVTNLSPDRPGEPSVKYRIITYSYPQYGNYLKQKGPKAKQQRTIRHQYDTVFEVDRLSVDTVHWRMRVGTGRDWVEKPPQKAIKQIYPENRKRWDKKRITRHRKTAKYLDVGDYNARVKGINADFCFRCAYAYWRAGHLYGDPRKARQPSNVTNPKYIMFFTKHAIHIIETLLANGVLKRDF
jgi:hypothetical protein